MIRHEVDEVRNKVICTDIYIYIYISATMEHLGESLEDQTLIAVLTPLVKHPDVKGRILRIEPRLATRE